MAALPRARLSQPQQARQARSCFFDVWDTSTADCSSTNEAPTHLIKIRSHLELIEVAEELPEQKLSTIRVYVGEVDQDHSSQLKVNPRVSKLQLSPFFAPKNFSAGLQALTIQLRTACSDEWYRTKGWYFLKNNEASHLMPRVKDWFSEVLMNIPTETNHFGENSHQQWVPTVNSLRIEECDGRLKGRHHALLPSNVVS